MQLGNCSLCHEALNPLLCKVMQAGKQNFHDDCFVCVQCFEPFPGGVYFQHEDRLYCEHDYWQLYGPRCAMCLQNIVGSCVTALNKKWHPEHFTCEACDLKLVGADFVKNSDRPLCRPCHKELHKRELKKPRCEECNQDILDGFLLVKGKRIHPYHMDCAMCMCKLDAHGREKYDNWYCSICYDKVLKMHVCGTCKTLIEGRSISALGKEYHPEHFVCAKCEIPFSGDSYHEYNGAPYCLDHYRELVGIACFMCQDVVQSNIVYKNTLNKNWCALHLRCFGCNASLGNPPKFVDCDMKPICADCWKTLPSAAKKSLAKQIEIAKKHAKSRA